MSEQHNGIASPAPSFQKADLNRPLDLRELIFRYLKYLPWVLVCVALALIMAKVKIRYSIPIFRVQASLLIKDDHDIPTGGKEGDKFNELFMFRSSTNLSNEIQILKSRPLLMRVAKDLGLQTEYQNNGNIRSTILYGDLPFHMQILQQPDSVRPFSLSIEAKGNNQFLLNDDKTPHQFGDPFLFQGNQLVLVRDNAVNLKNFSALKFSINWSPLLMVGEALGGNIKIVQVNNDATILTLSQETPNVTLGEDILNTIMAVYDTMIVEDKNRIAYQTLRFIDNRLDTLKHELGNVEGSLRIFMENTQAFNIEDQSKVYMENLMKSSDDRTEQEIRMNVVDWLLKYIDDAQNNYKTVPVNLGIVEPSLEQLIVEYNRVQLEREAMLKTVPRGNQLVVTMEGSIEKLRKNIYEVLLSVKQAYVIARNKLLENESQVKSSLISLPRKSMQALNIERQQKILEDLYSFLLQKKLETTISSASTISNSKVIEPALGGNVAVKPDAKLLYISYALFGLIIPLSIIAVFEMLNDKVNSRTEIEKATQTPILGEVGHSDDSQTLVVTQNSRSFISEQFRIIRTNLQYIIGKKENPAILVTSSFSGEGKSFISTNLGAVMALTGKRTVIMEFDIRKPKILSGLDLKRNMGISNYIIGKASFEELPVAVEGVENLYVIPCGPIPPNPSELLLSPRLTQLMEEVKENFDVVIMDTAPVGLVSDAINLGQFADCSIYIVRNRYTIRRLLSFVDELYIHKKLPPMSILLNDIKLDGGLYGGYYGSYGYGTGYGYGQGHRSGYFENEGRKKKGGLSNRIRESWKRLFG